MKINHVGALAVALMASSAWAAGNASGIEGLGRPATPAEIAAWDIDVRPDFKGLPKGRGTVARGQDVWESKCASCHGVFGESNEVFTPLVGGTSADDIKTGRVKSLVSGTVPQRTTLMKVPTVSSLFDYIRRAMPWNAPKSLSDDDVYAVLAYMLSLADVVPADGALSDQNIAQVQQRMPNRNGMSDKHGMWRVGDKPDVQVTRCMVECKKPMQVASSLPAYAINAHGNIRDQNRPYGPVRGLDTVSMLAGGTGLAEVAEKPAAVPMLATTGPAGPSDAQAKALLQKNNCLACHGVNSKIVGPAFSDVKKKYAMRSDGQAYVQSRISQGSSGVWGPVPMPAQTVSSSDLAVIGAWLVNNK